MPAHIRRRVKAIREARLASAVIPAPPAEVADNPAAYREALTAEERRAADGHGKPVRGHLALVTGTPQPDRTAGPPMSLRAALAEFRASRAAKEDGHRLSPEQIALQQAEEARAARKAREDAGGAA